MGSNEFTDFIRTRRNELMADGKNDTSCAKEIYAELVSTRRIDPYDTGMKISPNRSKSKQHPYTADCRRKISQ